MAYLVDYTLEDDPRDIIEIEREVLTMIGIENFRMIKHLINEIYCAGFDDGYNEFMGDD